MILTSKKNIEDIKRSLQGFNSIVIVGCSECAAICQTGGSEQVKDMENALSENEILATISIESPCDKRISTRDFRRITEELNKADAIVSLTCGSGVQAVSEVTGKPVISALDTLFLGMVERLGEFHERCSTCGDCILNYTASICPITLCPKGIRNGPCEGIVNTKCEVYEEKECVWHLIYEKLKDLNRIDNYSIYHEPLDWSLHHSPREKLWKRRKS